MAGHEGIDHEGIFEIVGFRFERGPIKIGPKYGSEVEYPSRFVPVHEVADFYGRKIGTMAKVLNPSRIGLYPFGPCFIGKMDGEVSQEAINSNSLTRHRWHYVPGIT